MCERDYKIAIRLRGGSRILLNREDRCSLPRYNVVEAKTKKKICRSNEFDDQRCIPANTVGPETLLHIDTLIGP